MKPSIFNPFIQFLRLHVLYLKISAKHLAAYKMSAFLTILFSLVFLVAEILTVDIYYQFSNHIGNWDQPSFYILLGTFNVITCLYTFFFEISHDEFVYKLRFGELDADLIRPMDAQAYTAIQRVDYASLFNLILPSWLIFTGIQDLSLTVTAFDLCLFVLLIANGVFIVHLINQFFVNFSFWMIDVSNLTAASNQVVQLGSRPKHVYPKFIQFGFSYVVPIILCTNLSINVLKHEQLEHLFILTAATIFLFALVRIQWKMGLKRYSSASS